MDPRLEVTNINFPFSLRGKDWQSLQHYHQAQKFHGLKLEETIRLAPTPEEALRLANESSARANWEKVSPEILYEGFLAQLEQYNELRTLILNTDAFVGISAVAIERALSFLKRLDDPLNDVIIFDLYEDPAVLKKDILAQETSEKRERARQKRNVWKDVSGGSLLEIATGDSSTVGLVGNNDINFPITALPNNAKFVVKKYQYEKRYHREDEDDEDDYEEDEEEEHQGPSTKISLADYIEGGQRQLSLPEFIEASNECLTELKNSRLNGSNLEELVEECKTNQLKALDFIETGNLSEEVMAHMLVLLDDLNNTLF